MKLRLFLISLNLWIRTFVLGKILTTYSSIPGDIKNKNLGDERKANKAGKAVLRVWTDICVIRRAHYKDI